MKDLLDDIDRWRDAGLRVAVARVVDIEGSGPRDPGAAMAVNEHGEVAGSVSGGCVEGAVVSEALRSWFRPPAAMTLALPVRVMVNQPRFSFMTATAEKALVCGLKT